jgi:hypothetical protein
MENSEHNSEDTVTGLLKHFPLIGNGSIEKFHQQRTRDVTMDELLEAVFSVLSVRRLCSEDQRKKSVEGQSTAGKGMSTEAEESTLLVVVTTQRLVKTWKTMCAGVHRFLESVDTHSWN